MATHAGHAGVEKPDETDFWLRLLIELEDIGRRRGLSKSIEAVMADISELKRKLSQSAAEMVPGLNLEDPDFDLLSSSLGIDRAELEKVDRAWSAIGVSADERVFFWYSTIFVGVVLGRRFDSAVDVDTVARELLKIAFERTRGSIPT